MANKDEEVDTRDALEILESESREADKDAEIDRILGAFRLDASVLPLTQPNPPPPETSVPLLGLY